MKEPKDIHSKKIADPSKQKYISFICIKTKGVVWYFAGRSDTYSYWCKTKERAIRYIIPYHSGRELRELQGIDGHKKCYIENVTEESDSVLPALFYKKIKSYF